MKIRITGKHLPKHQGIGPSQVMGNSMGFPNPFDYQKGMDKITGKFDPNTPLFPQYQPQGLPDSRFEDVVDPELYDRVGVNRVYQKNLEFDSPYYSNTGKKEQPSQKGANFTNADLIFRGALTGANAVTNMVNDRRRQSEFNRNWINNGLNPKATPQNFQSRGDYDINTGLYAEDMMTPPSKGMFTNPYYGTYRQDGGPTLPFEQMMPVFAPDPIISVPEFDMVSAPMNDAPMPLAAPPPSSSNAVLSENMALPLDAYNFKVTSGFGKRKAPKTGASTNHGGVDLGAKEGANIYSIKPGKVVSVHTNSTGGKQVVIQHQDGTRSGYAHLKDWAIKQGDNVNAGDVIGFVGSTGVATGPHLHFTLTDSQGNKIDPMNYINFNQYSSSPKSQDKNKKLYASGGMLDDQFTNFDTMKIRITGGPSINNMEKMKYGGQMGYGLDLNQRKIYTDMPDSYTDSVSKSMSEEDVPEEEYAIEAEGGETIYHPDGSHYNIEGDRHSEGGVKLTQEQAPEGSFVFSDTAKMRIGGDILKMFGKPSGKKYTPAQIAKQYDINKYQAILDDKYADPVKKKTGGIMKANYQNKLAQLALVQESKKNFRDGIPQMALPYLQSIMGAMPEQDGGQEEMAQVKYGGHLTKYQELGTVNPVQFDINGKKISASKSNKAPDSKEGWKEIHRAANRVLYELPGKPGQTSPGLGGSSWKAGMNVPGGGRSPISYTLDDLNRNPSLYKTFLEKEGWKNATPQEQEAALKRLATGQRSVYVPGLPATNGQAIDPRYLYTETAEPDSSGSASSSQESGRGEDISIGANPQMTGSRNTRQPWMMPDRVNMLNALSQRPKKYLPFIPDIQVAAPQPTFDDWRGRAAARQSMYNTSAQTMGAYGPTQGLASNLSYMAGQQGDALSKDIGDVSRYNTGVANQYSSALAELMNKANEYRANRQKTLFDSNTIANQAYDNSLAGYRNNVAKAFGQGWGNASMLGIRNFIDPYNYIDSNTGQMRSKNVNAMNMIKQMMGRSQSAAGGNDAQYEQALSTAQTLKSQGFDPSIIKELLGMKFGNPGSGQQKQGFGVSADMMTPYVNPYLQMLARGQQE